MLVHQAKVANTVITGTGKGLGKALPYGVGMIVSITHAGVSSNSEDRAANIRAEAVTATASFVSGEVATAGTAALLSFLAVSNPIGWAITAGVAVSVGTSYYLEMSGAKADMADSFKNPSQEANQIEYDDFYEGL